MKNILITLFFLAIAQNGLSHGRWIVPSHTILSGDKPAPVSFDFSISNDIFHPDYAYGGIPLNSLKKDNNVSQDPKGISEGGKIVNALMASTKLSVHSPDGKKSTDSPIIDFGRKSVSATVLNQSGTYRISIAQNPIYFTWFKNKDGEPGREFGTPSENTARIPADAKDITGSKLMNTVETFVTRNNASENVLALTHKNLEYQLTQHPNELFVGEPLQLTLYIDGKPVKEGVDVSIIHDGTRYRNNRQIQNRTTNSHGTIDITWEKSGLYLIETEIERESNHKEYQKEIFALYLTLEVNQE